MTDFELQVARLPDVLAVRVVGDETGCEVHVLARPGRPPGEIARDTRSLALLGDIKLTIDDVHVVQLGSGSEGDVPASQPPDVDLVRATRELAIDEGRIVVERIEVTDDHRTGRAIVTLRRGEQTASGASVFVPTSATRRRGVAEAAIASLEDLAGLQGEMAVDSVVVMPLPPHEVAVVSLAVLTAGGDETLMGAARIRDPGTHDAIVRAVLDATNRWVRRPQARRAGFAA